MSSCLTTSGLMLPGPISCYYKYSQVFAQGHVGDGSIFDERGTCGGANHLCRVRCCRRLLPLRLRPQQCGFCHLRLSAGLPSSSRSLMPVQRPTAAGPIISLGFKRDRTADAKITKQKLTRAQKMFYRFSSITVFVISSTQNCIYNIWFFNL